jgi:hypothetical protein
VYLKPCLRASLWHGALSETSGSSCANFGANSSEYTSIFLIEIILAITSCQCLTTTQNHSFSILAPPGNWGFRRWAYWGQSRYAELPKSGNPKCGQSDWRHQKFGHSASSASWPIIVLFEQTARKLLKLFVLRLYVSQIIRVIALTAHLTMCLALGSLSKNWHRPNLRKMRLMW